MRKNQPIDEGFQLLISLAEIHVPRMWVEQLPDNPESRVGCNQSINQSIGHHWFASCLF